MSRIGGASIKVPDKVDELYLTVCFFDKKLGDYAEDDVSVRFVDRSAFFEPLAIISINDWIKVVDLNDAGDVETAELVDDDLHVSVSRSLKYEYTTVRAWFGPEN